MPGRQQSPETPKIRPDRSRGSFGARAETGTQTQRGAERTGVVVVEPCEQVRRDTPAVGGDGGVLRGHPHRCRLSRRQVLMSPNLTDGLRLRTAENRARLPGVSLVAWPDCDPAEDEEGAAVRDRRGPA
ncbi:hypothetical protein NDU88_006210 [Pleurodeles waltl]|uniref:Uncharacterized protein n=1 Tax=Pleurodeles waltl TaxID=8319 RepID=A0AAV7UMB3_PLEWA|nr:hypothetical protein NDU88_006210 [Pleurodeles waltl]